MFSLKGKNIIIVGGTSGMGLASTKHFLESGANIVAIGLDPESCNETMRILDGDKSVVCGDATNAKTIEQAIDRFSGSSQKIHGLFHVAGGSGRRFGDGPLHELTLDGWLKTMELNLTSLMLSNQAIIKYFLEQNISGTILNMSSVLGYSPSPKYFVTHAYAAAKAAIIGFSQSIASYYAVHNIRINVLAPSLFLTPMAKRATEDETIIGFLKTKQPLDNGRAGKPEDIVGAAAYFMSDYSSFTTGQVLSVDGGWHLSEGQYIK